MDSSSIQRAVQIIHTDGDRNKQHPVWNWWNELNDAAPHDHREMFYALRKYAEQKFRTRSNTFTTLYYVAAASVLPERITVNTIRDCDVEIAWGLYQELKDACTIEPRHVCSLQSTVCKPLVEDIANYVAPQAHAEAWIAGDDEALARVQAPRSQPNPLYTDMRRKRVRDALSAVSRSLRCIEIIEQGDDPMHSKLDKKAASQLNKLVDDVTLFAMRECYPSAVFISAVFRKRVPLLKDIRHMRKEMSPEARLIFAKRVVGGMFDLVTACTLVPKGPVIRTMEYIHAPVIHANKKRCIRHT